MEHGSDPRQCSICGLVPIISRLNGTTHVVAHSVAMQELLKRAALFAASDASVAVLGDTGTGKEVVARVIHANSPRAKEPFVAVNVAALPADLLESELFGHGKGAFTGATAARRGLFEAAHKGTLFLDEIGEMPPALQAKLLRVLQGGEMRRIGESNSFAVDARIVCATHRNLAQHVADGLFREDLYYRLKVLTLSVPPLRERADDILPLARHFLAAEKGSLAAKKGSARGFTERAEQRLADYSWPGNVRELENVVKHGAALARGSSVDEAHLPEDLMARPRHSPLVRSVVENHATLAEVEREHVLRVLDACHGSQSEAARVLGIARNTLWRKLRKLGDSA